MNRSRIVDDVRVKKVLISDGAWGTFFQQKGLQPGESPEYWCVTRPADVLDVATRYMQLDIDMIESNSFGGTHYKQSHYGLQENVTEINMKAAAISRQAAGNKHVIASVGPTGKMLIMGDVTAEELYEAFKEQVIALERGGADAVCIETMSDLDEACIAIKAVKENTQLEVICTFTFEQTVDGEFRTMMGISPTDMAQTIVTAGADVIGTNCGNGMDRMIPIVKEIRRAAPNTPILVHANAGLPEYVDGQTLFRETPEYMASKVPALIEAGANIIGGCCGTTPAHIQAIKQAVDNWLQQQ